MEVYEVGGAVRDALLGLAVSDRDWVVVGATPEDMLAAGYKPVGRDFPVFIHPRSGEEYALARTERKRGRGHKGFVFHTGPDLSLEDDLRRRDLTINAIARTADGTLVDPFGGRADLQARCLRHVSPAFAEDPLRVFRVARFAARLEPHGFRVAPETLALMQRMAASGELAELSPERVWNELAKAMRAPAPQAFVATLHGCGGLHEWFPEIEALFGVPQPPQHHPEVDTGRHLLLALEQAAAADLDEPAVFAVLVHDLGKGVTPAAVLPSHRGHEVAGVALVDRLCERLKAPRAHRELGRILCRWHLHAHRAFELRPGTLLKLLEQTDALRRPQRFEQFIAACAADAQGRQGRADAPYPQADYLRRARATIAEVDTAALAASGLEGRALGEALRVRRLERLAVLTAAGTGEAH